MRDVAMKLSILVALLALAGCAAEDDAAAAGDNPFLEDQANLSKEDTQYMNPDGIEVEVDLEGDVEAGSWDIDEAPAILGQFALTYFRKRGDFYLESIAEDATSKDRVEWRVDGNWMTAAEADSLDAAKKTHFRIRGINAVLLHDAADGVGLGKQFMAKVPKKPMSIMKDAGKDCADHDSHMSLDQSIYWYMWNPDKSACKKELVQDLLITVSKMLPSGRVTYPEFDQLVADAKVTAVVLFGQIDDGALKDSDTGMVSFREMSDWLLDAKFREVTPAPLGRRFSKQFGSVEMVVDLYSPKEFAGLSDYSHFDNLQTAIDTHEILVYDGHSMLGASDFWAKLTYPKFYQIFLYGGCLGYEYYVKPILGGKGGWETLDIMSSVVEVSATANEYAGPFLAKFAWALDHNFNVSWKDMLTAVRKRVGDSTFGMSGVRENCFSPAGSLCGSDNPDPDTTKRYDSVISMAIPDNNEVGVASVIQVPDTFAAKTVTIELDVTHPYVGDLRIVLLHDGTSVTVWDNAGGAGADIQQSLTLDQFAGVSAAGSWTLTVADGYAADEGKLNRWALVIGL